MQFQKTTYFINILCSQVCLCTTSAITILPQFQIIQQSLILKINHYHQPHAFIFHPQNYQYYNITQMIVNAQIAAKNLTTTLKYFKFTFYGNEGRKLMQKYPNKYKKISRINSKNGLDLQKKEIQFPLSVPLKIKYVYHPQKAVYVDNSKNIEFDRLQGNEVLLAFEQITSLSPEEVVKGLERLAIQPRQEEHNWNQHPWIKSAFEHIKVNKFHYPEGWALRLYNVMKKLHNVDPEMWKLIYGRLQKQIFKMGIKDFIYFWQTYHNDKTHFSAEFIQGLFKLMQVKLRSFPTQNIIKAMHIMEEHGRIDHFYTHNVFLPLFKSQYKRYSAPQIAEILKILMLYNIETYERFYEQFYPKLLTVRCENHHEARDIKQALIQMQDIFHSHIIAPYIQYFEAKEKQLRNKPKIVTQKQLFQMVHNDIHYYKEKVKMGSENK